MSIPMGGGVHPPEFSQKGSSFTAELVDEHCTRRVPLSKTRTLQVHVYVYVYVGCTCILSVQLSESGTPLVQYTSRTPNHPLVYQPPKVYPPPPEITFQIRKCTWLRGGTYTLQYFHRRALIFTAKLVYEGCTRF